MFSWRNYKDNSSVYKYYKFTYPLKLTTKLQGTSTL